MQDRNSKVTLPDISNCLTINKCTAHTTNPSYLNQISNTINNQPRSNSTKSPPDFDIYKPKRLLKKTSHLTNLAFTTFTRGTFKMNAFTPNHTYENFKSDPTCEFRTEYIIKYAENSEKFNKSKKYADMINETRRNNFLELHSKIKKLLDTQNRILFDESSFIDTQTQVKQLTSLCFDYNMHINKFCDLIFSDLQFEKDLNMKLRKRNFELENILKTKADELNDLNKFVNRYDISTKIHLKKGKEETIEHIKKGFVQKENSYLLKIYKLEDEIRDLTVLLDKNKEYFDKFKETEKRVEEKKKQNEEMRFVFNKELHDKAIENAICKDKQYELNENIKELNKEIEMLKEENEQQKRESIDIMTQNKKLISVITVRNENLAMLNEEMETYMLLYDKEKEEHHNTTQALAALENRYYRELEEREEKEKKERENLLKAQQEEKDKVKEEQKAEKKEGDDKTEETTKNVTVQIEKDVNKEKQQQQPILKLS